MEFTFRTPTVISIRAKKGDEVQAYEKLSRKTLTKERN